MTYSKTPLLMVLHKSQHIKTFNFLMMPLDAAMNYLLLLFTDRKTSCPLN